MKTYKEWMENETKIFKSLCNKYYIKETITYKEFDNEERDRGTGGPIRDVYMRLCEFNKEFPWNEDYETMMKAIEKENNRCTYGIEDIDGFLQIFRCSLILYDRYKSKKYKNKYTINELRCCVKGGFRGEGEYIFKKVRIDINTNYNKYNNNELFDLYGKYAIEFCDHDDNYL